MRTLNGTKGKEQSKRRKPFPTKAIMRITPSPSTGSSEHSSQTYDKRLRPVPERSQHTLNHSQSISSSSNRPQRRKNKPKAPMGQPLIRQLSPRDKRVEVLPISHSYPELGEFHSPGSASQSSTFSTPTQRPGSPFFWEGIDYGALPSSANIASSNFSSAGSRAALQLELGFQDVMSPEPQNLPHQGLPARTFQEASLAPSVAGILQHPPFLADSFTCAMPGTTFPDPIYVYSGHYLQSTPDPSLQPDNPGLSPFFTPLNNMGDLPYRLIDQLNLFDDGNE